MVKKFTDFPSVTAAGLTANDVFVGAEVEGNTNFKITVTELQTLVGSGGVPAAGNVLYVDGDVGDDDTGEPYETLMAARTAAVSGDLIVVYPGTYSLSLSAHNLAKNGVNWHFMSGVTVQVDDTSTAVAQADRITGFFDDSAQGHGTNADLVCRVTGHAKFRWHIAPVTVVEGPALFRITRANSNLRVEFDEVILDETETPISAHYYYIFACEAGSLFARGNYVYRQAYVPVTWWKNGQTFIDVNHIQNINTTSIPSIPSLGPAAKDANTGGTPTGFLWIRAQQIDGHLTSTGSGKNVNSTMWVECQQLRGTLLQSGGKVYVKCQKWLLELDANNYGIAQTGGILWLEADKVTTSPTLATNDSTKGYAELGGESYINVRQWEDLGLSDITTGELRAVHVYAGTHYITSQILSVVTPSGQGDLANPGYAVAVTGGTLHFSGRITSTDSLCNGFLKSGGTLILNQVSVSLTGSVNSIYAGSAQSVEVAGSLSVSHAPHANITLTGATHIIGTGLYLRPPNGVGIRVVNGTSSSRIDGDHATLHLGGNSGTVLLGVGPDLLSTSNLVRLASGGQYSFGSGAVTTGSDSGMARSAAGVVKPTNGSTGAGGFSFVANTPTQITADQNNYSPGVGLFQRWSSNASRNITGLLAGVDGETRYIWNVGSQNIVLQNENASSTAANRFTTSTGADLTLSPNKVAVAQYDTTSTRWRAVLLP